MLSKKFYIIYLNFIEIEQFKKLLSLIFFRIYLYSSTMSLRNLVTVGILVLLCSNMVIISNGLPFLQWPLGKLAHLIRLLKLIYKDYEFWIVLKFIFCVKAYIITIFIAESRASHHTYRSSSTARPRHNNLLHRRYLSAKRRNDILDRLTS